MDYVRKIANSDILSDIINIPENMRNKKVEIIILPYAGDESEKRISSKFSLKGKLKKYGNMDLLSKEESAWAEAVKGSYENS